MSNSKTRPDRRSVRLKHYDYSQSGFYLVTICVEKHRCIFGDIRDDAMHRNGAGQNRTIHMGKLTTPLFYRTSRHVCDHAQPYAWDY